MNDIFYPGGQPYTPPHELTEEELEQVRQYLEEMKKRRVEEKTIKINEAEIFFEACVEEIRFLLEEDNILEVDIPKIFQQVSDMSALQGRLRDLCRDRTKLLSWEEEVTG